MGYKNSHEESVIEEKKTEHSGRRHRDRDQDDAKNTKSPRCDSGRHGQQNGSLVSHSCAGGERSTKFEQTSFRCGAGVSRSGSPSRYADDNHRDGSPSDCPSTRAQQAAAQIPVAQFEFGSALANHQQHQQQLLERAAFTQHQRHRPPSPVISSLLTTTTANKDHVVSAMGLAPALSPVHSSVQALAAGATAIPLPHPAASIRLQHLALEQQHLAKRATALNLAAVTSARAAGAHPAEGALPAHLRATATQAHQHALHALPPQTGPVTVAQRASHVGGNAAAAQLAALNMVAAAGADDLYTVVPLQQQQQQQRQQQLLLPPSGPSLQLVPSTPGVVGMTAAAAGGPGAGAALVGGTSLYPQLTAAYYIPPIPASWGAQVPTLSVQDRPLVSPVYNGINPNYPGVRLLHAHPPIYGVENFLNPAECDFLIRNADDAFGPAPVVGKGVGEVSLSRTSSTCYLAREDLPEYLRKVSLLTGKPAEHCELPQVGRYYQSQQYLQHFDAFDLSNEDGRRFAANGGQRTVTVLVYLNDVPRGGATAFPNLSIEVRPRRGMALVFFPSTLDGLLDKMALHAAMPAVDVKYVSQVWIRQGNYNGRPSKRLTVPMVAGLQERRENERRHREQAQAQMLMGQMQLCQQQHAQQQLQEYQAQQQQQQQIDE